MLFVYLKESYHDLVYKVLECFNPKKFLMTVFSNKVIIEFQHSDKNFKIPNVWQLFYSFYCLDQSYKWNKCTSIFQFENFENMNQKKDKMTFVVDLHKCQSSKIGVTLYKSNCITFAGLKVCRTSYLYYWLILK